jgi:hypothetical protein
MAQWLISQFQNNGIFDYKRNAGVVSQNLGSYIQVLNFGNFNFGAVMQSLGLSYYEAQVALEPRWQNIFTAEELKYAAETLQEQGFSLTSVLHAHAESDTSLVTDQGASLAPLTINYRSGIGETLLELRGCSNCEIVAASAKEFRNLLFPHATSLVRRHLAECERCRGNYPDLSAAYQRFDLDSLARWTLLLSGLETASHLLDEDLARFLPGLTVDDFDGQEQFQEQYDVWRDIELDNILRVFTWRLVRLSQHIGHFMEAYTSTFGNQADSWLNWRKGQGSELPSQFVRQVDQEWFRLGLLALHIYGIVLLPTEKEHVLWVPADDEILPVREALKVDRTDSLDEWTELLGDPRRELDS